MRDRVEHRWWLLVSEWDVLDARSQGADFSPGETLEWAVQFDSVDLVISPKPQVSVEHIAAVRYRVNARVVATPAAHARAVFGQRGKRATHVLGLDIGIVIVAHAMTRWPDPMPRIGEYASGTVRLTGVPLPAVNAPEDVPVWAMVSGTVLNVEHDRMYDPEMDSLDHARAREPAIPSDKDLGVWRSGSRALRVQIAIVNPPEMPT